MKTPLLVDFKDLGHKHNIRHKIKFVISGGFQIPCKSNGAKDIVDPFVELVFYSTEHPLEPKVLHKTKIVNNNGLNPRWEEQVDFDFIP